MPEPQESPAGSAGSAGAELPKEREMFGMKKILVLGLIAAYLVSAGVALVLIQKGRGVRDTTSLLSTSKKLFSARSKNAVGWIALRGAIYDSDRGRMWGRGLSHWTRRLKALARRKEVKAIVIEINSPGGSIGAVQEIYSQVLRVRKESKKPVVAFLGDVAASGGYYVAAACDKIVAHPGTLTGSVGVIFQTTNLEGLMKKLGITSQPIKSGKFKDIGSAMRAMTPEERQLLQDLIDDAYGQFLTAVSEGRNMPELELRPLADGRIFTGRQAKELGLVDALGDSQDALELAGKLGGISGTPRILRESDPLESLFVLLESSLGRFFGPGLSWDWTRTLLPPPVGLEYRWPGF